MLHPYSGRLGKYRFASEGKGATRVTEFEGGTTTYSFNSLGYRGDEFDPEAPVKLFVCGCSYTFGAGLDDEETWAHLFRQKLADHHGLPATSVNLINFAEGGASNDYITRTLIEQSSRVRPDVIVAGFTYMNRFELFDQTTAWNFGSWAIDEERLGDVAKLGQFQFLGTDETQEKIRMIKNVLAAPVLLPESGYPVRLLLLRIPAAYRSPRRPLPSDDAAALRRNRFRSAGRDRLGDQGGSRGRRLTPRSTVAGTTRGGGLADLSRALFLAGNRGASLNP